MYTLFAYRLNDKKDAFEKFVIEDIDDTLPEDTKTPQEYLQAVINITRYNKEISIDKDISEWYTIASKIKRKVKSFSRIMQDRGISFNTLADLWNIKEEYQERISDLIYLLNEECIFINGNNEEFLKSDFFLCAPEEVRNYYYPISNKDSHNWIKRFYKTAEEQASLSNIRPTISEDEYKYYTKDTAKSILRDIIAKFVRDSEDSTADAIKLIIALTNTVELMYNVLPDSSKVKLTNSNKSDIETVLKTGKNAITRFSAEYESNGSNLIKSIYEKESTINDIINMVYANVRE